MDEVDKFIQQLKDPDANARLDAAEALREIKDDRSVPALIDALKDKDFMVAESAALALGGIKDKRAVEALVDALNTENPLVQAQAAYALGEIGDARAVRALIGALNDWFFLDSALEALVKIAKKEDISLSEIQILLRQFVERAGTKDPNEREGAKQIAAYTYQQLADAHTKRKQAQMDGKRLPAKIKPPKPPKKGVYRAAGRRRMVV